MIRFGFIFTFLLFVISVQSQILKPGFDPSEYSDMLHIASAQMDTNMKTTRGKSPKAYDMVYRSPEMGFYNQWSLWTSADKIAVISLRGTTNKSESWLENFYSAMIPAQGSIQLSERKVFNYKLAENPNSYVHAGWTVGIGFLSSDIIAKMKEYREKGFKDFIVTGHSQGGALAFLLRSFLKYSDDPNIPKDITIKTYCSAAPKPGNMNYAYDFDHITRGGWAYRVVNADDWVPETPFSVQTLDDMNKINPFKDAKKLTGSNNKMAGFILNALLKKFDNKAKNSVRLYRKYLGKAIGKFAAKSLPGYVPPDYAYCSNYMPAGASVVLMPDSAYHAKYQFDGRNIFIHHAFIPYLELLNKNYVVNVNDGKR